MKLVLENSQAETCGVKIGSLQKLSLITSLALSPLFGNLIFGIDFGGRVSVCS